MSRLPVPLRLITRRRRVIRIRTRITTLRLLQILQSRMTIWLRSVHALITLHRLQRLLIDALAPVADGALDFVGPMDRNERHKTEGDELPPFPGLARHVVAVGAVVSFGFMAFPGVAKVLGWVSEKRGDSDRRNEMTERAIRRVSSEF